MGLTFLAFVLSNSDCQASFKLSPNENPADASITNGVSYSSSGLRLLRHHLLHLILLDGLHQVFSLHAEVHGNRSCHKH